MDNLVEDSRKQYARWLAKEFIKVEELEEEIGWALRNGSGMVKTTTTETFSTFRGGYNCRHEAIPSNGSIEVEKYKEPAAEQKEKTTTIRQSEGNTPVIGMSLEDRKRKSESKKATKSVDSVDKLISELQENGFARGASTKVGEANEMVQSFLKDNNIELSTPEIRLTDKKIQHSLRDAKADRGAAISLDEFKKIEGYISNPDSVLFDKGRLVYTKNRNENQVMKFVIELNYKESGDTYNNIVTVGVVKPNNLETKNYKKIKKR